MNLHQPSLWDNLALENGYRLLIDLNFKEAVSQFKKASQFPIGDPEPVFLALKVCEYWKDRLKFPINIVGKEQQSRGQYIADFLDDYLNYSFPLKISGFKKALLSHLVGEILKEKQPEINVLETILDLLLELKVNPAAKALVSHYMQEYPEKMYLHYLLAQVQWKDSNKDKARRNYANALLYCPESSFLNRIEDDKLKNLLNSHGPEMALPYGRLYGILPYVPIKPEFHSFLNEKHEQAIQVYLLLRKLQQRKQNGCTEKGIQYRKQLMELDPDFYEVYFSLLQ